MGYIGMCRCEGYGFQAIYSRIGYINHNQRRLGVEQGIIFQETDQLVEDFIQTRETATLGQGGILGVYSSIGQQNIAELAPVQVKGSRVLVLGNGSPLDHCSCSVSGSGFCSNSCSYSAFRFLAFPDARCMKTRSLLEQSNQQLIIKKN